MRYVALLRGINVGGKNRVPMIELRACFEMAGFSDISTYINSGNVIFSSNEKDILKLIAITESVINARFHLGLKTIVMSLDSLRSVLEAAPADWGKVAERKHNLLFVRPPKTSSDVISVIRHLDQYETVTPGRCVVYWSASLSDFGKTASSSFASQPIYKDVTVRNYNTSVKLLELMEQ